MNKKVLITGGAGFIGSHLTDELLRYGYNIRVLDNLLPQVHGPDCSIPAYLSDDVEFIRGDVRDRYAVSKALVGVDVVYHFAAAVGVGQSMYQIRHYTEMNNLGTAVLLECLSENSIEKLIVASSMSVYGEGLYSDNCGAVFDTVERSSQQLRLADWEPKDQNGIALHPIPTPESKRPSLASLYALSKYDQERMAIMIGKAYGIPAVALRFFNVYGTRQSLNNPYTGVLAIFASRLLNNRSPIIFEDGNQRRDFVSVKDVAKACRLVLESSEVKNCVLNIGSGRCCSVKQVAQMLSSVLEKHTIIPSVSSKFRAGDIRHCFADIKLAKDLIGYSAEVELQDGLCEMAQWLQGQIAQDNAESANAELVERGLWA